MIVSLLAIFIQNKLSISATAQFLNQYIFSSPRDSFKLFVPAVLFALQNNLLYIALSNLNATVYQVSYQVKILTTALFSVWMLKKHLTISKWIALILLAVGVVIVQLTQHHTSPKKINGIHQNHLLGLSAVLISAVSSGYAGCYFERVLKNSESSLWIRNIQLGIFSLLFAIPTMWFDSSDIIKYGFFSGYTNLTWLVIFNQALGGIVVAMVVRYADNILKSFSTSVSILLSCCIDFAFFGFVPTHFFVIGAGVVLVAVFMYAID
ncbi:hypothetical protein HK098_003899 [Nowakowskiella sp. JEL0407]|nr:hypothetical protein HK098_003899 [Nowakowskiella sp. JEL0407]